MTYRTEQFSKFDKTYPGVYSRIVSTGAPNLTTAPVGVVSMPVSLISADDLSRTEPIHVTSQNALEVFSDYTFHNHQRVNEIVREILVEANEVLLVPLPNFVSGEAYHADKPLASFGCDETYTFQVSLSDNAVNPFDGYQATVTIGEDHQSLEIRIQTPFNTYIASKEKNGPHVCKVEGLVGPFPRTKKNVAFGAEDISLDIKWYHDNVPGRNYVVPQGGYYSKAIVTGTDRPELVGDGLVDAYRTITIPKAGTEGKKSGTDAKNGSYLFAVKNTQNAYNDYGYYLLELGQAKGQLLYYDFSGEEYSRKIITSATYAKTATVGEAIGKFSAYILPAKKDADAEILTTKITSVVRLVFSAIRQPRKYLTYTTANKNDEVEFAGSLQDLLEKQSYIASNILYLPDWKYELTKTSDAAEAKQKYQEIQKAFVLAALKHEFGCQLLMDEDLNGQTIEKNTGSFSLSHPLLVTLRSASSTHSETVGGYTAGLLASMGVSQVASAHPYMGSLGLNLPLYSQEQIEKYFAAGCVVYHRQGDVRMVYIDRSAYVNNQLSQEFTEDVNKNKYTDAFARNQIVRVVSYIRSMCTSLFTNKYFSQPMTDYMAGMLHSDIYQILNAVALVGGIEQPSITDVKVTKISETGYSAELVLKVAYAAEQLYLTIGV